jgi:hypothetical protein
MRIAGKEPGMSFLLRGSGAQDSLIVLPEIGGAAFVLSIPVRALPWRDARLIQAHGPRMAFGCGGPEDPLRRVSMVLEAPEVADRTGIRGASRLQLENGTAAIRLEGEGSLLIPCLRIANGAELPAAVQVVGRRARDARGRIHVLQLSGGRRTGGVTLELGLWDRGAGQKSTGTAN